MPIDLVPFGPVGDENARIHWPPDGHSTMSVLGFAEAYENADLITLQEAPALEIPVATPAGMALLKLIAWTDRSIDLRKKDALDLRYLLTSYELIPAVDTGMYEQPDILEDYGWDTTLAAAHLLGAEARAIAQPQTQKAIQAVMARKAGSASAERLVEDMCSNIEEEFARNQQLLSAFVDGFAPALDDGI